MFKPFADGVRRGLAWMLTAFMILSQFAFPAAALAVDLSALPTVFLYYAEGEAEQ